MIAPKPDYWIVKRGERGVITPGSPEAREALITRAGIHARGRWWLDEGSVVVPDFTSCEAIVTSLLKAGFQFAFATEQDNRKGA